MKKEYEQPKLLISTIKAGDIIALSKSKQSKGIFNQVKVSDLNF